MHLRTFLSKKSLLILVISLVSFCSATVAGESSADNDIPNIVQKISLSKEEEKWHNQLIEVLFGEFDVAEFQFRESSGINTPGNIWECHMFNASITNGNKTCASEYFLLMYSCLYQNPAVKRCSCDKNCNHNNSCCFDSLFLDNPNKPDVYIRKFVEYNNVSSDLHCLPFMNMSNPNIIMDRVMMKTSCKLRNFKTHKQSHTRCDVTEEFEPPVYVPEDGFIYQNAFCAKCNGYDEYLRINATANVCIRKPDVQIQAPKMDPEDVYGCHYRVHLKQDRRLLNAVCDKKHIWTLRGAYFTNDTYGCNEEEFGLCLSYSAKVIYQFKHHANPHCVKCMRHTNHIAIVYNEWSDPYVKEGYTYDITYVGDQMIHQGFRLKCSDNYQNDCYRINVMTDTLFMGMLPLTKNL